MRTQVNSSTPGKSLYPGRAKVGIRSDRKEHIALRKIAGERPGTRATGDGRNVPPMSEANAWQNGAS